MEERKKKESIDVLHVRDLNALLEEYGLYEKFEANKLLCRYCNIPVSMNNIYGIFINDKSVEFLCERELCYENYLLKREEDEENV